MKRVLVVLLIVAMVPLFMGIFCPCAKAADSLSGPAFTKVGCHRGCCPEISAAPDQAADQIQNFFSIPSFSKISNVLKALSPDESRDIAINRRTLAPAGGEPFFLSPEQPLYLSLQVFRI